MKKRVHHTLNTDPSILAIIKSIRAEHSASLGAERPPHKPLIDLKGRDPKEFNQALHYLGDIEYYARDVESLNHDAALPILNDKERAELRTLIARVAAVHATILADLNSSKNG